MMITRFHHPSYQYYSLSSSSSLKKIMMMVDVELPFLRRLSSSSSASTLFSPSKRATNRRNYSCCCKMTRMLSSSLSVTSPPMTLPQVLHGTTTRTTPLVVKTWNFIGDHRQLLHRRHQQQLQLFGVSLGSSTLYHRDYHAVPYTNTHTVPYTNTRPLGRIRQQRQLHTHPRLLPRSSFSLTSYCHDPQRRHFSPTTVQSSSSTLQKNMSSKKKTKSKKQKIIAKTKTRPNFLDEVMNDFQTNKTSPLRISILGPPNAGKSTLFNRLLCKQLNKGYKLGSDSNNSVTKKKRKKFGHGGGGHVQRRVMNDGSSSEAVVSNVPGTTRDRRECWGRLGGTVFRLMDTAGINGARIDGWTNKQKQLYKQRGGGSGGTGGGTGGKYRNRKILQQERRFEKEKGKMNVIDIDDNESDETKKMELAMMEQTLAAAKESDIIFLMMDGKVGMTYDLVETARWLRRQQLVVQQESESDDDDPQQRGAGPKIVVLANKLEGNQWLYDDESPVNDHLDEVLRLGLGPAIPISAVHGEGMADIAMIIEEVMEERRLMQEQEGEGHSQYQETDSDDDDDAKNTRGETNWLEEDSRDEYAGHDDMSRADDIQLGRRQKEKPLQLAIVGRPNVGKSTLVNAILQQERVITGSTPGLTRDAIAVDWSWNGRPIQLVDTAGIRKIKHRPVNGGGSPTKPDPEDLWTSTYARANQTVEDMSVANALRAIKVADVVVLVLDAQAQYLHRHEIHIANEVMKEGRALVIAANKMDLIFDRDEDENKIQEGLDEGEEKDRTEYTPQDFANQVREQLEEWVPMLRHTPIVPMSGLTGERVENLFPVVFDARERWSQKVSTSLLNSWLKEVMYDRIVSQTVASGASSRKVRGRNSGQAPPTKIKYIIQTKGRPPTFLLFCNQANVNDIPESFVRYLTKHFQDTFEMYGMPIRMIFKPSANVNPFDKSPIGNKKERRRGGKERRKRTYSSGLGGREARKQRLLTQLRTTGKPAPKRTRRRKRNS